MGLFRSLAVCTSIAIIASGASCVLNFTNKDSLDDPLVDDRLTEQIAGHWLALPDTTAKHALLLRTDSTGNLHPTYVQDDTLIDTSGVISQVTRALGEWSVKDGALNRTPQFCFSHDTLLALCTAPAPTPVSLTNDLDTLKLTATASGSKTIFQRHPN